MLAKKREESHEHAHHFRQVGSHWRSLPELFYGMVGTLGWLHMEWLQSQQADLLPVSLLFLTVLCWLSSYLPGEECGSHWALSSSSSPSSKPSISCLPWFQYLGNTLFSFCCYPNSDYHCFCRHLKHFYSGDRVSLSCLAWPWTCYVSQAGSGLSVLWSELPY